MARNLIDAVTVCVNYSDYLKYTIGNSKIFNSFTVITVKEDEDTIRLCEKHGIRYVFSERICEGGKFWKGRGINDGLAQIEPKGWVALVDADIILMPTLKEYLDTVPLCAACLYGLKGRYNIPTVGQLKHFIDSKKTVKVEELAHVDWLVGFFQLWHTKLRKYYPEASDTAGLDDVTHRNSFATKNRKILDAFCLHLGPSWMNHKGRRSPEFK